MMEIDSFDMTSSSASLSRGQRPASLPLPLQAGNL
jgi:hypothetical protein